MPADSRFCPRCGTPAPGADTQELLASSGSDPTGLLDRLRTATEGEFRIIRELGRGGMGRVFLAHELALDRRVAMKVLPPAFAGHEGIVQRFIREARTAGKLSHPHIVPVYQVSKRDELTFFTMPCVVGPSLRQVVRQTSQLSIDLAHRYIREAAGALGYAHRQGVIHRDIKPENMLLEGSRDGRLLLTDFGIAKALGVGTTLTQPGDVMGTPYYMSPEQCEENEVDGRSDQYSLGLVGYEMLAGRFPFTADSMAGIVYKHLHEDPEPVENFRPDVPENLRSVVERATKKDPDERFPTMAEMIKALGTPRARTTAVHAGRVAARPKVERRPSRRRWTAAAGIAAAALALAAVIIWQQRASSPGLGNMRLADITVPAGVPGLDTVADTLSGGSEADATAAEPASASPSTEPAVRNPEPAPSSTPANTTRRGQSEADRTLQRVRALRSEATEAQAKARVAGAESAFPDDFAELNRVFIRAHGALRERRRLDAGIGFTQARDGFLRLAERARQETEAARRGPRDGGEAATPTTEPAAAEPVEPAPEVAIAELVETYRRTLEAEDTVALAREVYRGPIPPENGQFLREIFRRADEFSVVLETKPLKLTDNGAQGLVDQTMSYRLASTREQRSRKFSLQMFFERHPQGWRLVRFELR